MRHLWPLSQPGDRRAACQGRSDELLLWCNGGSFHFQAPLSPPQPFRDWRDHLAYVEHMLPGKTSTPVSAACLWGKQTYNDQIFQKQHLASYLIQMWGTSGMPPIAVFLYRELLWYFTTGEEESTGKCSAMGSFFMFVHFRFKTTVAVQNISKVTAATSRSPAIINSVNSICYLYNEAWRLLLASIDLFQAFQPFCFLSLALHL